MPAQTSPLRKSLAKPRLRWAVLNAVVTLAIVSLPQTAAAQPVLFEHFGETADSLRLQMTPPTADRPPLIGIVALSWVVFWMNEDALGRRAGVSATAMLTIVAYQFFLSTSLPRVAYLTTMDVFTLLSFGLIVLSMGINVLVTREKMLESGSGRRIDRLCRILLPAGYFAGLAFAYTLG